jgi:hypothetical protein
MTRTSRGKPLVEWVAGWLVIVSAAGIANADDSWDAVYVAGAKVGSIHTYIEPVTDHGRELLRVRLDLVLEVKRLGDRSTTRMQYGTIETKEGEVLRLDTRILASNDETRIHGDVVDGKMKLIFEGTGERQEQTIDWGPDVRGPYAAEQSFAHQPMKPGEVRKLRMFMPDVNKVYDVALTAKALEDVKLGGGVVRRLTRIEQTHSLEGKPRPEFDLTLWADARGQVLKTKTDLMGGMVTFRTTRAGASAPSDAAAPRYDQIVNSVIKVTHKIPRPLETRDVRYRIALKDAAPGDVIPTDRRQSIAPGTKEHDAILAVKTAGPNDGAPGEEPADDVYLRPNAMITSKDDMVVSLSKKAVGNAVDPWDKSVRIVKWVSRNFRNTNFETAFAAASEVARNLSGDCTEYAVLTAAMCRAAGVPTRVVVGLLYVDRLGGFGFHMWNEVYVNRRWVAIDATWEQESVDAVHIKIADASLDGVSPFEAFLPIVRVLDRMTIEPIEIR